MTEQLSVVFGLLALASLGIAVAAPALVATGRGPVIDRYGGWLAAAIAITAMSGSLYYSEIADYTPCLLCWWQRVFMYPIAIVMGAGLVLRRSVPAWQPAVLSVIGAGVSAYHYWLQVGPTDSVFCDIDNPCSVRWVDTLGVFSIPSMAFCGFVAIASLSVVRWRRGY